MQACLQDPEHGYYRRQPAIGRGGDFITAPEISQVFGELVGLWCAVVWQQMGSPRAVRLIELGPGRGTLMRDALRAARLVAEFRAALHVELVESNAALEPVQRETLSGEGIPLLWSAELLPGTGPAIVIANEFIDTLPAAQWMFRDGSLARALRRPRCRRARWPSPTAHRLCESAAPCRNPGARRRRHLRGARRRHSPPSPPNSRRSARPLRHSSSTTAMPGRASATRCRRSARHRHADPLHSPGEADLTSQVDFAAFADAMRRARLACDGPTAQGEFLGRLGIIERASRLMAANPAKAAQIETDIARLMAPGGMGGASRRSASAARNLPRFRPSQP